MVCISCKTDKEDDFFNWKNRSQGKRQAFCRDCYHVYKKRHYQKHRVVLIAGSRRRTIVKRERFKTWKSTLSCSLCGESEEACLDFHHVDPSVKEAGISDLATNRQNFTLLTEELKKCVVVCRNCHMKVHKYNIPLPYVGVVFNG